jgi:ABC-type Fe3+-siderophore transport system permease subunit
MFTLGAFVLIVAVAWYAGRLNVRALSNVVVLSDEEFRTTVLNIRQDVKLIAFLLGAIIVMLGVIADRIH